MSANSGIAVSEALTAQFSSAIESKSVRFIKISIHNESLVHDLSVPIESTFQDDLAKLQGAEILEDDTPAYVLAKLDDPAADWLAISYVPDTAKVRDKMLYASTRTSLLKSLGSQTFSDSLFATSKSDLTPDAYSKHRAHVTAPKPLSTREQEMADIRAAEREATSGAYNGAKAVATHIGNSVGLKWAVELQDALKELGDGSDAGLIVVKVDTTTETLVVESSSSSVTADTLGSSLPQSEPCYAFFAWPHDSRRDIVFIYSCPSTSPVKHRMVYSTGSRVLFNDATNLLSSSSSKPIQRTIQTSDPSEINEAFLQLECAPAQQKTVPAEEPKGFAKPRGPPRRK